jgi:hypothetical protein
MDCCFVRERASIQMQQTVTQPCNRRWEGSGCYDVVKFEASDIRSVYQSTLAAIRSESVTAVLLGLFHTDDPVDDDLSPRDRREPAVPRRLREICRRDVGHTRLIISENERSVQC